MKFFKLLKTEDLNTVYKFIIEPILDVSFFTKIYILFKFIIISKNVSCSHTMHEILTISQAFLNIPSSTEGVLVEAGAFKGGSTAKLSIIAKIAKRRLVVFDSFRGLPQNSDMYFNKEEVFFHNNQSLNKAQKIFLFNKGQYAGSLQEVKENISRYGVLEVCSFHKGWFEKTLPKFSQPVAGIFLDVDLASSTRTCLQYLYPLLQVNGVLFSHDGHLNLVADIYKDKQFWKEIVGTKCPKVYGLQKKKLLKIKKTHI